MQRRLASITAAILVAAGCAASDPPAAGDCPSGFIEGLDAWGDAGFNGTVAIIHGDESCIAATGLRDRESAIDMTADTVFAIGSVSKSVTAAAIMRLVTDGEMSLDAKAGEIVDGLTGPAAKATVEQLLVHTSGMLGDAGPDHQPLSTSDAVAAISELPLAFPAGTDFGYTNAGYTLLALVIDELTGDYGAYVADHILSTIVDDNELRTYVTVTGGMSTLDLWYALTEQGAIAAAEGPTDPPSAAFSQQRADVFVNVDPTGERPEVTLTFGTDTVVVDNGTTITTARKVP